MSNRKPYVREMKRTWWKDSAFYRFYMIREATVLPLIFFTICLTFGLGSLVKGPEAWQGWLDFMANPIVIILNILALAGSLFHAFTYFNMMPQVVPIRIKGKLLDKKIIILAQWAVVAVITLFVLAIV
ncbi:MULTISPECIES: fumarate reductase subunit FrdC [unclassified Photobacterium]|uniref:fumarate reductase subunit FrdC n=1 Tax=unclassified Photobacterium TaxID=2628852 RepID=UPI000D17BB29|nr:MULTISPECIES: fumarate reductase subunit FrdC [unclassified Photobacterium]PSV24348.1 fumarate reductase subunit FrdC [Photobacterium sp. GB-56]PSV29921.1 fumarate reductase subunit FrdC [Photobacterium sp. GB-72]PSV35344.1 fumarate reductase subunit FrdC [Photobacterium sp. GB-210]PSV36151.1 fumarate reductase subunit FrdC [Photobacterium sp. GB-27]PSV41624.1 fumarate reductase subunit FrdC [Photobacterium sp. GB-36]